MSKKQEIENLKNELLVLNNKILDLEMCINYLLKFHKTGRYNIEDVISIMRDIDEE